LISIACVASVAYRRWQVDGFDNLSGFAAVSEAGISVRRDGEGGSASILTSENRAIPPFVGNPAQGKINPESP